MVLRHLIVGLAFGMAVLVASVPAEADGDQACEVEYEDPGHAFYLARCATDNQLHVFQECNGQSGLQFIIGEGSVEVNDCEVAEKVCVFFELSLDCVRPDPPVEGNVCLVLEEVEEYFWDHVQSTETTVGSNGVSTPQLGLMVASGDHTGQATVRLVETWKIIKETCKLVGTFTETIFGSHTLNGAQNWYSCSGTIQMDQPDGQSSRIVSSSTTGSAEWEVLQGASTSCTADSGVATWIGIASPLGAEVCTIDPGQPYCVGLEFRIV